MVWYSRILLSSSSAVVSGGRSIAVMRCLSWRGLVVTSRRLSAVIMSHQSRFRGYRSTGRCLFLSMYIV